MVDLNLLPWREGAYRTKLKRLVIVGIGIFCALLFVIGFYWSHSRQQMQVQAQKSKQLQEDLVQLRALYRQQLLTIEKQKARKKSSPKKQKSQRRKPLPQLQNKFIWIHYAKVEDIAIILRDKTNALLSKKGRIAVDQRTNILWIEDKPDHLHNLIKLIGYLDVPAQQIIIEARLVNMNQEAARDLGLRLGLISPNPPSTQLPSETSGLLSGPRLGLDLAARTLESAAATLGFTQAIILSQRVLDFELSALESQGKAKVIASPRLITSNQIPAVIEAGEDIPYQEFSMNGNTSIAFKKAVLRLQVVPQITAKHELMMALVINQDADSGKRVQGVPIIATKSIETRILVKHGQTVVLGGIYQEDRNRQTDQIPFLGDLPWIGDLFQRHHMRIRHEALLIFITPRIISFSASEH